MITLAQAMREGRLPEIIAQEEARGVGPVDGDKLDQALAQDEGLAALAGVNDT